MVSLKMESKPILVAKMDHARIQHITTKPLMCWLTVVKDANTLQAKFESLLQILLFKHAITQDQVWVLISPTVQALYYKREHVTVDIYA